MLGRLAKIYGASLSASAANTIAWMAVGSLPATLTGSAVVHTIAALFPPVFAVTALVSGSLAALVVTTMGVASVYTMEYLFKKHGREPGWQIEPGEFVALLRKNIHLIRNGQSTTADEDENKPVTRVPGTDAAGFCFALESTAQATIAKNLRTAYSGTVTDMHKQLFRELLAPLPREQILGAISVDIDPTYRMLDFVSDVRPQSTEEFTNGQQHPLSPAVAFVLQSDQLLPSRCRAVLDAAGAGKSMSASPRRGDSFLLLTDGRILCFEYDGRRWHSRWRQSYYAEARDSQGGPVAAVSRHQHWLKFQASGIADARQVLRPKNITLDSTMGVVSELAGMNAQLPHLARMCLMRYPGVTWGEAVCKLLELGGDARLLFQTGRLSKPDGRKEWLAGIRTFESMDWQDFVFAGDNHLDRASPVRANSRTRRDSVGSRDPEGDAGASRVSYGPPVPPLDIADHTVLLDEVLWHLRAVSLATPPEHVLRHIVRPLLAIPLVF